ncbi:MAG: CDP-diacylglycerol--glycerol-3-phosphate 3-phosphatidyltransferase [Candidatus Omnitrophica bacterium]|nr:CDP-diacylglycerol--glycerol-3-phosphate 3-phosphatidyltransferase [Candidatus Omnitrophota bacterium]
MSLPNILTLSRIVFAFFIVLLLLANTLAGHMAAAILFTIAAWTDFYDGYLAKRQGLISDFGKIMDPIADKVLMLAVFGVLAHLGMVLWWMVMVIAAREAAVTVSRLKAMARGRVLAAESAGKIKTVCQMLAIAAVLLFLIAEQSMFTAHWFYRAETAWRSLINVLMMASVFLTVVSGAMYFRDEWKNR